MSNWFDWIKCEHCNEELVMANGYEDSKVLIVGAYPGNEEIKHGRPMVGKMGTVLREELSFLGVHLDNLRYCNLWAHKVPHKKAENLNDCFEFSVSQVVEEVAGKEFVLLMGKEPVQYFLNLPVLDTCGLIMKSHLLSMPVMSCINPAMVWQVPGAFGELKLALKKFVNYCEEMELL